MVAATTLTGLLVSALLASARPAQEAQHPFADDHHSGPINPLKREFELRQAFESSFSSWKPKQELIPT
jgi:hypothetical protein